MNGAGHYDLFASPCPQPAFCLWKNFSQRISLIRALRKCRNKRNSSTRLNNISLLSIVKDLLEQVMATLQYSCLENPMDGGAWWVAVHGVAGSQSRLSDFTFTFHFHALEKEMATHSSVLAWRISGTGEPGGLPSMGLHRVRHD